MAIYRRKNSFTAGELSPLLVDRTEFKRHAAGSKALRNMVCTPQGPVTRRSGFKFIYDIGMIGADPTKAVREIPFVYTESQAYALIIFTTTGGTVKVAFGYDEGLVLDGGGVYVVDLVGATEAWVREFDWAQNGNDMYFVHESMRLHTLSRATHTDWAFNEITVINEAGTGWGDPNNWPQRVTLHQQRLILSCTNAEPQKEWLSKAGGVHDFTDVSLPTTDDGAFAYTFNSGSQNKIQWTVSGKQLYTGTLASEWTTSGSGNTTMAVTYANKLAQRQSSNGSVSLKPLSVNQDVIFAGPHGRTAYAFASANEYYGYSTEDLSILAPHLTENNGMVDWTYQQIPHSIIWAIRDDGILIALTYQKQHEVVGWHRHYTRGGTDKFLAITAIPGATQEDDVWTVVKRNIGGIDYLYVEKLEDFFTSEEAKDGRFLDSLSVYDGPATNIVRHAEHGIDLEHLIGETIGVLADGTVHPDVVVDAADNGTITLDNEYSLIVVGFNYSSEVRPTLSDVPTNEGTSTSRVHKISSLGARFYKTLGLYFGRYDFEMDEDHEEEIAFRVPSDLMGNAVPLFTGIRHISYKTGFDRDSEYYFKQKQPLPFTLVSVTDNIQVS